MTAPQDPRVRAERSDKGRGQPAARRERLKVQSRVSIAEVRRLRAFGEIAPSLSVYASQAEVELAALMSDLGGADQITTAQRALAHDFARLSVVASAVMQLFLRTGDPSAAGSVVNALGARRATLVALFGADLERKPRDVSVGAIVAQIQAAKATAEPALDVEPEPELH